MKSHGRHPSNALTAKQVEKAKGPARLADGGGLYLIVDPSGARRWQLRVKVSGGKRVDMGLGGTDVVTLAEARDLARHWRRIAKDGRNPVEVREGERLASRIVAPTFREAAEAVHAERAKGWRNAKHAAQWISTLNEYADPVIGLKAISDITTADVHAILAPIWHEKPETARRVRQRVRTVLDWAAAHGHRSGENPAALVSKSLGKQMDRHEERHHAAMPYRQVSTFVAKLRESNETNEAVRLALEFTILTAARTGEALGAMLPELNLDEAVWTVPSERMKTRRPHRVPLSERVLEIVRRAMQIGNGSSYLFPGARTQKPLSNMALLMHMRRAETPFTVHGFRSSFRDWAGEQTNFPREVCEAALAHVVKNKAEAAYARSDLFDKRRKLMEAWASFIAPKRADVVVPLKVVRS